MMKLGWKYYPSKAPLSVMGPYFVLAGNLQTINESNYFVQVDLYICEEATNQNVNAVIINESNDGVS